MRTTDPLTSTLLGDRYLLTRPLGAGASATVYLAEDQSLRREVAVKVLRAGLTDDDAFLRRFRAEAVAVAGLNHPHVLRVFDWGEADGDAWLVTEYLSGGSLRDLLDAKGRLSIEQAVSIGSQAADGLAYAHAMGFVHRDVKPANLLFDDTGRVRIADFGVARALAEAAWTEPADSLIGTVRYTSPEQAQGRQVDGKADVYSLSLVLYESVTGEVPFVADSQVATLNARIGAALPFHPALGDLEPVLRAAAAPDPAERLDAAQLFGQLSSLSRVLHDPTGAAGARAAGATIGFHPPSAQELTTGQHRAVAARRAAAAAAVAAGTNGLDVTQIGPAPDTTVVGAPLAAESAVGPETATQAAAPASSQVAHEPSTASSGANSSGAVEIHSRRRWPVFLVALVLLLAAAGAVFVATNPFATPTYRVPLIVGDSITEARQVLASQGFTLKVVSLAPSNSFAVGTVIHQEPAPNTHHTKGTAIQVVGSAGPPPVAVPSVVDKSCVAATAVLEHAGFTATCPPALAAYSTTIATGLAVAVYAGNAQNPSNAARGSALTIVLSKGRPPAPIPGVVGLSGLSAVSTLQQAGFSPVVHHVWSRTVHAGNVVSTTPVAGTTVQAGKTVQVFVSAGAPATVPSLGTSTLSQAEAIIVAHGLTVRAAHGPANSTHWSTVPPAGSEVTAGSSVVLYGT